MSTDPDVVEGGFEPIHERGAPGWARAVAFAVALCAVVAARRLLLAD